MRWPRSTLIQITCYALIVTACTDTSTSPADPPPWRVSAPATAGSSVDSHGWSAELHGTTSGDLVMEEGPRSGAHETQLLQELTAPGDLAVGAPVELTLTSGSMPSQGVTVRRHLDTALVDGQQAALAYFDTAADAWIAIPTTVSDDRKTLTAQVDHFTAFTDFIYNVFTRRRDKPSCHGSIPDWARDDPTFFDASESPMRWCAGSAEGNPDILVVKVAVNRAYGTVITPAVTPEHVEDTLSKSLIGLLAGEDLLQGLMARTLSPSDSIAAMFGGKIFLPGGHEAELRFTEAQVRAARDKPLVSVDASPAYALAGQMYDAISAVVGPDNRGVAIAMTVAMAGQCLHDILDVVSQRDLSATAAVVTRCLLTNTDAIAEKALAMVYEKHGARTPEADELEKRILPARRAMIQVWLAGKVLQLAEWFIDRKLAGAAWAFSITLTPLRLTFRGYGPLTVGLTAEQALATGVADLTPMRIGMHCTALATGNWSDDWEQRLSTLITSEAGRTVGVNPPKGVRTDRGVGVGSSVAEVLSAYTGHRNEPIVNQGGPLLLIAGPDDLYLGFQLGPGNVVTDVLAGQRDYASAFELCSGS